MKQSRVRVNRIKWYKDPKYLTIGVGAFFIFLMVFSTLSMYDPTEHEDDVKSHGLSFIQTEQGWVAYTDYGVVQLMKDPRSLEDLGDISKVSFSGVSKIYLTFNPLEVSDNLGLALWEMQRNIDYGNFVTACTEDVEGCENLPLRTCSNASATVGVVQFEPGNESSITFEDNCLLFKGDDPVALIDWFILEQKEEFA